MVKLTKKQMMTNLRVWLVQHQKHRTDCDHMVVSILLDLKSDRISVEQAQKEYEYFTTYWR